MGVYYRGIKTMGEGGGRDIGRSMNFGNFESQKVNF